LAVLNRPGFVTVHFEKWVPAFRVATRTRWGTELREASRSVLMQVLRANNASDKVERSTELLMLRDRIEALLLAMRVARDGWGGRLAKCRANDRCSRGRMATDGRQAPPSDVEKRRLSGAKLPLMACARRTRLDDVRANRFAAIVLPDTAHT
jgi:hypothetical protein